MNVILNHLRPRALGGVRTFSVAVRYSVNGQAKDVFKYENVKLTCTYARANFFLFHIRLETVEPIGKLSPSEVALKFIAAPINPADINLVRNV